MAGLDPAISLRGRIALLSGITGTSPVMTRSVTRHHDPEFQTAKLRHPYFLSAPGTPSCRSRSFPRKRESRRGPPLRGDERRASQHPKSRARGTPGTAPRLHEAGPTDLDASQHRGMLKSEIT